MPTRSRVELFKTVMQVFAILCLVAFFAVVLHKATVDVSALANQHPGSDFWPALGRYLLRNLGAG